MLLAYLLLFLLHLSGSACDATSWNHLLLHRANPGAAAVPAPSPASHDHRGIAKDLMSYHLHYSATMAPQGGPPPLSPTVEVSGAEGVQPQEKEISAAMSLSPSPSSRQVDGGGADGRSSSEADATDQEERAGDVGVDYEAPKTHPPSHN